MFSSHILEIKSLLSNFLGDPKSMDDNPQTQFCCPCCAERKCVESDGKYNLECNIEKGVYQCWVCGDTDDMSGKISGLIKKYGNIAILNEYYSILKDIKESALYSIFNNDTFTDDFVDDYVELKLPYGSKKINSDDEDSKEAYEYLIKRGLGEYFIKTFNLHYTNSQHKNPLMRNRIIIPSYSQYGELNYWVGRDYKGDSPLKYKNPKIEKKSFVFNEKLVNWYDNITLVEGTFDHMVVPNSIPLLGKSLKQDYAVYQNIIKYAKCNVNIFLDDDAIDNAKKLYKFLNNGVLRDRIRLITPPDGYDASSVYEKFGSKGIIELLQSAEKIDEYDLKFIS